MISDEARGALKTLTFIFVLGGLVFIIWFYYLLLGHFPGDSLLHTVFIFFVITITGSTILGSIDKKYHFTENKHSQNRGYGV